MEADKLIEKAKNKESSNVYYFLNKLLCVNDTHEESIAELYINAANLYYIKKDYENAISAYINASEYDLGAGNYFQMIECYNKIQSCFLNLNKYDDAIIYMKKCSTYFFSKNKMNEATKYEIKIAEVYERMYEYTKAIDNYKIALSYSMDNSNILNNCLIKLAELNIKILEFCNAVEYYELYLENIENDKLLKYKHTEIVFKVILCYMSLNIDNISEKVSLYCNKFSIFETSVEYDFIINITKSIIEKNLQLFEKLLCDYNSIKKLDYALINILTNIKKNLEEFEDVDFQ